MIRGRAAFALALAAITLTSCQREPMEAAGSPRPTDPLTPEPPQPPRRTKPQVLIVDGTAVKPGKMMAVVGLTRPRAWTPSCTGTLIAPDVVLSAAHCFCGGQPTNGDVYVGDNASKPGGLYYKIVAVRLTMACSAGSRDGLDLAVARLKAPVRGVTPVAIAPADLADTARQFRIAGYGAIDYDATLYTWEKREAPVGKLSSACTGTQDGRPDADVFGCKPGEEIVAGQRRSPDSCAGDSGGPLLVAADGTAGPPSASNLLLAGVTSRSISGVPRPCGYGGIYERLTAAARREVAKAIAALPR